MNGRDYNQVIHGPLVRRGTAVDISAGTVESFYVQLELNLSDEPVQAPRWMDIAWFDHQPNHPRGHDLRQEPLHMDIRHPVEGTKKVLGFKQYPIEELPYFCERYFDKNYPGICDRYIRWFGLRKTDWLSILPNPI